MQDHSFRQRYWARSYLGFPRIVQAQPNTNHKVIAQLQDRYPIKIVTQNVDHLHQRAGAHSVLELHGGLYRVKCTSCHHIVQRDDFQQELAELNPFISEWATQNPGKIDPDVSSSVNPDGDVEITWNYDQFRYPSCPSCKTGVMKPESFYLI